MAISSDLKIGNSDFSPCVIARIDEPGMYLGRICFVQGREISCWNDGIEYAYLFRNRAHAEAYIQAHLRTMRGILGIISCGGDSYA